MSNNGKEVEVPSKESTDRLWTEIKMEQSDKVFNALRFKCLVSRSNTYHSKRRYARKSLTFIARPKEKTSDSTTLKSWQSLGVNSHPFNSSLLQVRSIKTTNYPSKKPQTTASPRPLWSPKAGVGNVFRLWAGLTQFESEEGWHAANRH